MSIFRKTLKKRNLYWDEKITLEGWNHIAQRIYGERELANIWYEDIKNDFEALEKGSKDIAHIIKKLENKIGDDHEYKEVLESINMLIHLVKHPKASAKFLNKVYDKVKKMIRYIEKKKGGDIIEAPGRRLFIKKIAVGTVGLQLTKGNLFGQSAIHKYLLIEEYKNIIEAMKGYKFLNTLYGNLKALYKINPGEGVEFIIQSDNKGCRTIAYSRKEVVLSAFKTIFEHDTGKKTEVVSSQDVNMNEGIFYIQFSFNKDEKFVLRNLELLKKYKNIVLYYDTEEGGIKLLLGPYTTEDSAADVAKKILRLDSVLDILLTNELGVVTPIYPYGMLDFEWQNIIKEIKVLEAKDVSNAKGRNEKRNKVYEQQGKKTYSFDQINAIIEQNIDKNEIFYGKRWLSLLKAIAWCESTYDPRVVGYKIVKKWVKTESGKLVRKKVREKAGRGLYQLMPKTAKYMGGREYTEEELFNPYISKELGIKYINYLKNKIDGYYSPKGDHGTKLKLILAAYNGGESAIKWSRKGGEIIKPMIRVYENEINKGYQQTRDYVKKVTKQCKLFEKGFVPKP